MTVFWQDTVFLSEYFRRYARSHSLGINEETMIVSTRIPHKIGFSTCRRCTFRRDRESNRASMRNRRLTGGYKVTERKRISASLEDIAYCSRYVLEFLRSSPGHFFFSSSKFWSPVGHARIYLRSTNCNGRDYAEHNVLKCCENGRIWHYCFLDQALFRHHSNALSRRFIHYEFLMRIELELKADLRLISRTVYFNNHRQITRRVLQSKIKINSIFFLKRHREFLKNEIRIKSQ